MSSYAAIQMEELCRRWRNQFHTSEQLKKHRGITESNILLKWVCDSPKHGVILLKIDTAQIRQQGFLREMLGCVCVTVNQPFSPTRGSSLLCPLCSTVQHTLSAGSSRCKKPILPAWIIFHHLLSPIAIHSFHSFTTIIIKNAADFIANRK